MNNIIIFRKLKLSPFVLKSPLDSFHACTSCLWSSLHFKKIHLVIKSSLQRTTILILMYDFILLINYRSFLGAICVSIQYNQIWRGGVFRCVKARNVSVRSESEHSGTRYISDQHESALPRWKKLQSWLGDPGWSAKGRIRREILEWRYIVILKIVLYSLERNEEVPMNIIYLPTKFSSGNINSGKLLY